MSARSTVALFGVPLARPPRRSPFDAPCSIQNFYYYFKSNSESARRTAKTGGTKHVLWHPAFLLL
jgi:hypothetical protein